MRDVAEARLNGQSPGVVRAPPFRIPVTGLKEAAGNVLEVEVVNSWANRVIGEYALPADRRVTRTNIRELNPDTPLMEPGLLGPVRLPEQP